MSLEAVIKNKVKSKDVKGIIVSLGNQSEVSWWDESNTIESLIINLKVEKSLSFTCKNGEVEIFYI
ncbi:MAG: hypothetical protein VXW15_06760 [Bdellovibrionota bacterium]|nr:hypothetical protein [Bdellovibrionota bacterium]